MLAERPSPGTADRVAAAPTASTARAPARARRSPAAAGAGARRPPRAGRRRRREPCSPTATPLSPVEQRAHRPLAHARREDAVERRRRPAALDVAEDDRAHVVAAVRLGRSSARPNACAGALGDDDDRVLLAAARRRAAMQSRTRRRCTTRPPARGCSRRRRQARRTSRGCRTAAHDLDDERALVARRRVAHLADGLADGVERRVEADRRVGAGDVVVDGARDADDRARRTSCERLGTAIAAVAADDDEPGRSPCSLEDARTPRRRPRRLEALGARRAQEGAAAVEDAADVAEATAGGSRRSSSPSKPRSMPTHSAPAAIAERTTARMAAFMPGASPPLVSTAILGLSAIMALTPLVERADTPRRRAAARSGAPPARRRSTAASPSSARATASATGANTAPAVAMRAAERLGQHLVDDAPARAGRRRSSCRHAGAASACLASL